MRLLIPLLLAASSFAAEIPKEPFSVWAGTGDVEFRGPDRKIKKVVLDVGQSTVRFVRGGPGVTVVSHPIASGVSREAALHAYQGSLQMGDPGEYNGETMTFTAQTVLDGAVDSNLTVTLPVGPAVELKALDRDVILEGVIVPGLNIEARGGSIRLTNVSNVGDSTISTRGGSVVLEKHLEALGAVTVEIKGKGKRVGKLPAKPTPPGKLKVSVVDGQVILRR